MSGNEKRRQKSLQRKAAKRKQKKRALNRQMETVPATPRAALRAAAKWPLYECLISRDWQVEGTLTEIMVARSSGPGEIAVAVFLVDLGLLGVKNAFAPWPRTSA